MKTSIKTLLIACGMLSVGSVTGQALLHPSGPSAIGTSNTNYIGIGTYNPNSLLHIRETYNGYSVFNFSGATSLLTLEQNWTYPLSQMSSVPEYSLRVVRGPDTHFAINTDGEIGVGTNSPMGLLDFQTGDEPKSALFIASDLTTANQGGVIHHQNNTYAWQAVAQNTNQNSYGLFRYNYVNRTNPALIQRENVLVLRGNGRVGVGTDDINGSLTVEQGGGGYGFILKRNSGSWASTQATLQLSDIGGEKGLRIGMSTNSGGSFGRNLFIMANGRVGVNTASPQSTLQVDGDFRIDAGNGNFFKSSFDGSNFVLDAFGSGDLLINYYSNKNVGIYGDTEIKGRLDVCNVLKVHTASWCDFVFEEDYNLMPLEDLETYIKTEKHLPEVKSAGEIEAEQSFEVAETVLVLLQKIEELTLYTIDQQKEIEALKAQMATQASNH